MRGKAMKGKHHMKPGGPKAGARAEAHAVRDAKGPAGKSHPKHARMKRMEKKLEGKAL